ncbi:tail fiber domain-containing protein [Lacinutrix iliipiscaria]|uniref:Tail fiber domain-containing protein n=1 Tax=Lacinutrix iliipiscaria TaxID=1230532 RepID=A0ABW5WM69_9FLAO
MKTKLTLFVMLCITLTTVAQQSINYKAVIKDDLGNVVTNQTVDLRFAILRGGAILYRETHLPVTDDNGIVIVNIGEGTPTSGNFETIIWRNDPLSLRLRVQVDIGSGLIDMGITEFKAVPYALNVTGLEALDEGNGIGWRIIRDRNPNNYGNIGLEAIDLSFSDIPSTTSGAIGLNSTAMGRYTTASGLNSTAIGQDTEASGFVSTAMGYHTTAPSYIETVVGSYNTSYIPNNVVDWDGSDRLFVIGNGSSSGNKSNALTVLKNGNIGMGTATPNYKLDVSGATNINEGVSSGIALRVNGDEALWYNGNYFSWGYGTGAGYNFFATNVGLGVYNPNVRLDVDGNIEYTGTITDVSDRRLKENIKPIENVLVQLQSITGYTYNMKNDATKKREFGVVAQDVQAVFPEMVSIIDNEDHLGVSYIQLIPVLLEAIKKQQEIIDSQNSKIDSLSADLEQRDQQAKAFDERLQLIEKNQRINN